MVKKKTTIMMLIKLQLRNLKKNIAQFLSIIMIGAIAITLFCGLQSNALTFDRQVSTVIDEGNLADLFVTVDGLSDGSEKKEIVDIVHDYGSVESRVYCPARIKNTSTYTTIVSKLPSISKPYGDFEKTAEYNEDYFAFVDSALEFNGKGEKPNNLYSLGDDFSLSFSLASFGIDSSIVADTADFVKEGGEDLLSDGVFDVPLKITGFMNHPENINKAKYSTGITLVSYKMIRDSVIKLLEENYKAEIITKIRNLMKIYLGKDPFESETLDYYNQYLIKLDNMDDLNTVRNKIDSYYRNKEKNNLRVITSKEEMPFYLTIDAEKTQAVKFTYVFPFVFFIVAILVILTTLSQMIIKDRTQIGTLKAIGLSKREIQGSYLLLSLILVLIGIVIGTTIGPLLIPNILGNKYEILYTLPKRKIVFPFLSSSLSSLFFQLVTALVTFLVTNKELSLKPVESMRPAVPKLRKVKSSSKKDSVISLSFKMAFRNIRLSLGKSFMVVMGIIGCTALLVCGFGCEDTIDYGVRHDVKLFANCDFTANLSQELTKEETIKKFKAFEQVDNIEPYYKKEATFSGEKGIQYTKALYITSTFDSQVAIDIPHDGIAIPTKIATKIGVDIGDNITFTFGDKYYDVKVSEIFDAFYYNFGIISSENEIFKDDTVKFNGAWMDNISDEDDMDLSEKMKEIDTDIASIMVTSSIDEQIKDTMSGILVMTNAVKTFAILLAVVVLYNIARMNFTQRSRDIATLRVLGFRKREISLTLLLETMTLTLLGVIIGLILGYPFMIAVLKTNIVELVQYLYHVTILSYFLSFVCTFMVAFVINFAFAEKTKKIQLVESLKSVE